MNRLTQKKLLKKNFEMIKKFLEIDEPENKFLEYIIKKNDLDAEINHDDKVAFQLQYLYRVDAEDIENICNERGVFDESIIDGIKKELDYGEAANEHANNIIGGDFGGCVDGFKKHNQDYQWNHRRDKHEWVDLYKFEDDFVISEQQPDFSDFNKLRDKILGYSWGKYSEPGQGIKYLFQEYSEPTLENALKYSYEILKDIFLTIKHNKRTLTPAFKTLAGEVKIYNSGAKSMARDILERDIKQWIEANQHLITKDISKIKFNSIAKIEAGLLITNAGANVKIDDAKNLLQKIEAGANVINEFIGNYKIVKTFNIQDNLIIRIGCHLFKIDSDLKNQILQA